MAQNPTVMAFRKRLKQRGYTKISIIRIKGYESLYKPNTYVVKAIEPLTQEYVRAEYNIIKMHNTFR